MLICIIYSHMVFLQKDWFTLRGRNANHGRCHKSASRFILDQPADLQQLFDQILEATDETAARVILETYPHKS